MPKCDGHERESSYDEHTIKAIIEDAFLLAFNINYGDLDEEVEPDEPNQDLAIRAAREWRAMELVIGLGERLARVTGIDQDDLWIPDALQHLVEV